MTSLGSSVPCFNLADPLTVDGACSHVEAYLDGQLDLHELLGVDAASCYFVSVEGESMTGERILDGDIVLVNRALEPQSGNVVIACLDGELTLKRLVKDRRGVRLLAGNPDYAPIVVGEEQELVVWGVLSILLLYISAVGIYLFEHPAQPEVFSSIPAALWWSVVSFTTVGYGDMFPITTGGRLLSTLFLFVGLGIFTVPAAIVTTALLEAETTVRPRFPDPPHKKTQETNNGD